MSNNYEDPYGDSETDSGDDDFESGQAPKAKAVKGKAKVAIIIAAVKSILGSYGANLEFKLNLRMLHYRLVEYPGLKGTGIYENTTNNYKWLSNCLAEARRHGELPWEIFEDKTRTVPTVKSQSYSRPEDSYNNVETNVSKIIEYNINAIKNKAYWYSLPKNLYQPDLCVIMLEKQALENVFKAVVDEDKAVLVVNKGYNSLTQLKDFADILKKEKRNMHLKCFSDFDPSGVDIQRNFADQMQELGVHFASVERIALTEELITRYALPYAPPKKTDTRAKNWTTGVVELDAVEPVMLQNLIKDCVKKHWDEKIEREVKRLEKVLKRRVKRECEKLVKTIRDQIKS